MRNSASNQLGGRAVDCIVARPQRSCTAGFYGSLKPGRRYESQARHSEAKPLYREELQGQCEDSGSPLSGYAGSSQQLGQCVRALAALHRTDTLPVGLTCRPSAIESRCQHSEPFINARFLECGKAQKQTADVASTQRESMKSHGFNTR
jgi:hypothetical protein